MNAIVKKRAEFEHKHSMRLLPKSQRTLLGRSKLPQATTAGGILELSQPLSECYKLVYSSKSSALTFVLRRGKRRPRVVRFRSGFRRQSQHRPARWHVHNLPRIYRLVDSPASSHIGLFWQLRNHADTVCIAYADKGGASALTKVNGLAQKLICREHRSSTFAGKFGKGCKQLYVDLADARTASAVRAAKRMLDDDMLA